MSKIDASERQLMAESDPKRTGVGSWLIASSAVCCHAKRFSLFVVRGCGGSALKLLKLLIYLIYSDIMQQSESYYAAVVDV